MSDVADMAEARIDRERARLSGLLQARVAPVAATHCDDCAEMIPEARRAAAPFATRCIHCQERFERQELFGRSA
ncbi:MAG: TraR/DksA C4-type zinc finger protein [Rhabdaerophilum sp.]